MTKNTKSEAGGWRLEAGKSSFQLLASNFILAVCFLFISACSHPMIEGKEYSMQTISKTFASDTNKAYEGVRWALKTNGYSITNENLQDGVITSGWLPSGVDDFYVDPFGEYHKDFGVLSTYYKLEIKLSPDSGGTRTQVEITSKVKTLAAHVKTNGKAERKIMKKIGDYLRGSDIRLTNIGIEE